MNFKTHITTFEFLLDVSQRIEVNEAVEFIYGKERNPCLSPAKMKWYDWIIGRDGRSECRDFLSYVYPL